MESNNNDLFYEVLQDLKIKGGISKHGIIIIITWIDWDISEIISSYLTEKKNEAGEQKIRRLNVPLNREEEQQFLYTQILQILFCPGSKSLELLTDRSPLESLALCYQIWRCGPGNSAKFVL